MDWNKIVVDNLIHYILIGIIGVLVYFFKQAFLKPVKDIQDGMAKVIEFIKQQNKTAGNQSTEFWEKKQREAILDTMRPFLENQTEILKNIASTNQEINRGIIELVTISRAR